MRPDKLFSILLRLYPAAFREEYEREMRLAFKRRYRETDGLFERAFLWLSILPDTFTTATREHFDMLMHDIRYSLRTLRKTPTFTAAVVLTLALGVGATTAIFSLIHTVLLRPLPYAQSDRVVRVAEMNEGLRIPTFSASALNFLSWQEQSRSFEALAVMGGWDANLAGDGEPERVSGSRVSGDFWRLTGVRMVTGRAFTADEATAGKDMVVILSEGLWRRRYGADPGILGRTIAVNTEPRMVVGIAPQDMGHTATIDVWAPLVINPAEENRGNHVVTALGRLRDGVTVAQANAELNSIAERLEQEFPESNKGWRVRLIPVKEWIVDADSRTSLYILMAAVGLLLAVACANIAALLVTRATARSHEFGVRLALGAGSGRLVRQLTTESLVLALIGGGFGVLIAAGAIQWLATKVPNQLPRSTNLILDWPVLIFALVLTTVVGVLFGLAPSWSSRKADIQTTLRESGRGLSGTGSLARLILVGGQVALATVLVVAALLLIQSFDRLQKVDVGFEPDHLLTAGITLPAAKYETPEKAENFFRTLLTEIQAIPGVVSAGVTSAIPMGGRGNTGMSIVPTPRPEDVPEQGVQALWRMATADYLRTMKVPLKLGRFFDASDAQRPGVIPQRPAIILSERLVGTLWRDGSNPVGRQVILANGVTFTVVGVVGDVRLTDLRSDPIGTMYFQPGAGNRGLSLAIRTSVPPETITYSLREIVKRIDPNQALFGVRTMDQIIEGSAERPRVQAMLLTAFAALALLLGTIGVAGVVAYTVERRSRDLAVRLALGATRTQAMRNAARGGMIASVAGLVFGLFGAWGLNRWLTSMLFQVRPDDPITFAAVAASLIAVALAACWLPARRAARIDPAIALKHD
jgi:putative ABC transport system permease protein